MNAGMYIVGWVLIHFVWQAALLSLSTALVLRLCRERSPSMRYAIACGAMAAMWFAIIGTAAAIGAAGAGVEPVRVSLRAVPTGRQDVLLAIQAIDGRSSTAGLSRHYVEAVLPWIVSAWLFGVALLIARAGAGWWRVRRLHMLALASMSSSWQTAADRIALRLGLNRIVRVVQLPHVDVPLVIGCLRPIVVLPIAALSQLNPAQVDAILAHELAHIRRHDYLVNLLQTVTETLFFYHPAVWWLSARIRDEREHCCDDIAVAVCGDPVGYAQALTELEALRSGELALAPAATGGSLLHRVRRILRIETLDESPASPWTIVVIIAALLSGFTVNSIAQTPTPGLEKLQFEIASVKPNKSGDPNSRLGLQPGGRIVATNVPLRLLIRNLYNVQAYQIVGAPEWIENERFDIEAKADREYPPQADGPAPELLAMMRNLLAERFSLRVHTESREMPVYALVAARSDKSLGPQLRRVEVDCAAEAARAIAARKSGAPTASDPNKMAPCGARVRPGNVIARGATLQQLTRSLSQFLGRTVIDRTGLPYTYDIDLEWSPEQTADIAGPSIFTAVQEQLGLKLDSTHAPIEVLVIDKVERPTPD